VAGYRPFPPTILGKASTAAQVATVFAAVSFQAHVPFVLRGLVQFCVYLAAALTIASGIYYVIVVRKRYGQHPSEPAGEN
jgi:phosphatidylglycerophosphate synthase